jgi:calcyclin binding protein
MVTVFLKKADVGKSWGYLTEKEKKLKDKAAPKLDDNADPQEGLMSMMKKMYDEGDDEMKRTISKAFTESREKSAKGEGFPEI